MLGTLSMGEPLRIPTALANHWMCGIIRGMVPADKKGPRNFVLPLHQLPRERVSKERAVSRRHIRFSPQPSTVQHYSTKSIRAQGDSQTAGASSGSLRIAAKCWFGEVVFSKTACFPSSDALISFQPSWQGVFQAVPQMRLTGCAQVPVVPKLWESLSFAHVGGQHLIRPGQGPYLATVRSDRATAPFQTV